MNTRKLRKAILTLCSALLLVSLSVGATLAYLTASTEVVKNTFTIGDVEIDLDEANVDLYGNAYETDDPDTEVVETERVKENEYKLLPGHKYTKDPIVYVQEGSEPCFVFVKVVNGIKTLESADAVTIEDQMTSNHWLPLAGEEGVYYYAGEQNDTNGFKVDAREAQVKLPVFTSFTIAHEYESAALANYATETNANSIITIDAYAIQADGFDSAAEAWTAQNTIGTIDWDAE